MEQPVQSINPVPQINPMEQPVQNINPVPEINPMEQATPTTQDTTSQSNEIFTTNGSQPFDINSMFANNK